MSNVVEVGFRKHEEAYSALQDVVAKWRALGATNLQIGKLLMAEAVGLMWEGEDLEALKKFARVAAEETAKEMFRAIG